MWRAASPLRPTRSRSSSSAITVTLVFHFDYGGAETALSYNRVRVKSLIRIACLCSLAGLALAGQTVANGGKRLYVDGLTTKGDEQKLRQALIAEIRKSNSVTLVSDPANADLILDGGGEIWVKGYHSFSPRSELKLPTNGTPIYGGFLSVELKNQQGVTLWSYLATPGSESDDVSKGLARRISKHLAEALSRPEILAPVPSQRPPAASLHAAGATFPAPVYRKWFINYEAGNPGVQITYDAVGSEAGIRKLLSGEVDFAASDSPQGVHEIAPGQENKYLFFPSVVGAVVPIVNLPGIPDGIKFTPEALAGIYLGKITKWNDSILKQANHGVPLPDLPITVIHRSDGSGTSYAFTSYLSQVSPEWKSKVGSGLEPKWPVGRGASGNQGVAAQVKELGGSIGYVEFIYALQNHINYGKVRNQNGDFVEASLESIAAAVNHSMDISDDLTVSIVDAPGPGSYPIASFTWLIVPEHVADSVKRNAIVLFLRWMLGAGQTQAAALGYLPLSEDVVAREEAAIARIH
jgi:phosphate ABC transporter phosphate-binding protein